jgi:hypothetical protein
MLTGIGRTIDENLAVLPHPSVLADLNLLMGLKLVMQKQPMFWASPEVVALDKFHWLLAHWAEPCVTVVY